LGLYVGTWKGRYRNLDEELLRFYDIQGALVPTSEEAQKQRADAAEAELTRLRARLGNGERRKKNEQ